MWKYALLLICFSLSISAGGQTPKVLGVLGSSTPACFAFPGGMGDPDCYVNRVVNYYDANGFAVELHNLAVPGYYVYQGMKTGSPPVTVNGGTYSPDINKNITKALSFIPDVIILNFPSNLYNVADIHDVLSYFRAIKKLVNDSGKICFVATTQPRNDFDANGRARLSEIKDSVLLQFGFYALNFWNDIANTDGTINPLYNRGDGVHLNAAGHDTLAQRVIAKDIFNNGCINRTLNTGNWNDAATWDKGIVPGICDSVIVMPGHTLTLDTSIQIKSLYVTANGILNVQDSNTTIQIGENGLFNKDIIIDGTLNFDAGKIIIAGRLQHTAGSNFNMTGGELIIKGNSGDPLTSINDGKHLFDISNALANFSFTGGTLQITDPPIGANSQAINCIYNFGDSSILKLGDGISITASDNINGFGGNLLPAQIGRLIIDAATPFNNRIFINLNPLTIKSPLEVLSGNLVQGAELNVNN